MADEGKRGTSSRSRIRKSKKSYDQFLRKSFTLIVDILRLIQNDKYPSQIARLLGTSKQRINYHVKKLVKIGYLRRVVRDRYVFYELTQAGKDFLSRSDAHRLPLRFRLHAFALKFPLLEKPSLPVDWGKVQRMRNWNKVIGSALGLTVEVTSSSLIIYAEPLEGENPYELLWLAGRECDHLAGYLESKFKMRLGKPSMKDKRPHFGVWDPVAQKFAENLKLSNDVADIDCSPPYYSGEIDWRSPELAKLYLLSVVSVPGKVERLVKRVSSLESGLSKFTKDMKGIQSTFEENLKTITDSFGKNLKSVAENFSKDMQDHLGLLGKFGEAINQLRRESEIRSQQFKLESESRAVHNHEVLDRIVRVGKVLVSIDKALAKKPKRKRRKHRVKPKPKSRWQKLRKKLRIPTWGCVT